MWVLRWVGMYYALWVKDVRAVKVPDILFINKKKSTTPTPTLFESCSDLFRLMLV